MPQSKAAILCMNFESTIDFHAIGKTAFSISDLVFLREKTMNEFLCISDADIMPQYADIMS